MCISTRPAPSPTSRQTSRPSTTTHTVRMSSYSRRTRPFVPRSMHRQPSRSIPTGKQTCGSLFLHNQLIICEHSSSLCGSSLQHTPRLPAQTCTPVARSSCSGASCRVRKTCCSTAMGKHFSTVPSRCTHFSVHFGPKNPEPSCAPTSFQC